MESSEARASFWGRLFRCTTATSADRLIQATPGLDVDSAREAWRAHRAATEQHDARLEARARDLEGLQALGRALAEARNVQDVLDRAAVALQVLAEADAVAMAVV